VEERDLEEREPEDLEADEEERELESKERQESGAEGLYFEVVRRLLICEGRDRWGERAFLEPDWENLPEGSHMREAAGSMTIPRGYTLSIDTHWSYFDPWPLKATRTESPSFCFTST